MRRNPAVQVSSGIESVKHGGDGWFLTLMRTYVGSSSLLNPIGAHSLVLSSEEGGTGICWFMMSKAFSTFDKIAQLHFYPESMKFGLTPRMLNRHIDWYTIKRQPAPPLYCTDLAISTSGYLP